MRRLLDFSQKAVASPIAPEGPLQLTGETLAMLCFLINKNALDAVLKRLFFSHDCIFCCFVSVGNLEHLFHVEQMRVLQDVNTQS